MPSSLQSRSIIVVDLVGFSRQDNRFQQRLRRGMYEVLDEALTYATGSGVLDWEGEDRGDSRFVLVPPTVDKITLIDPFVDRLATELDQHNDMASAGASLRMRLAVHCGELHRDRDGWSGDDLTRAFRLVDSEVLHEAMSVRPEAVLGVIASERIHDSVIRNGYASIDPASYECVDIPTKHALVLRGWLRVIAGKGRPHTGGTPGRPPTSEMPVPTPGNSVASWTPPPQRGGAMFLGGVSFGGDNVSGDKNVRGW